MQASYLDEAKYAVNRKLVSLTPKSKKEKGLSELERIDLRLADLQKKLAAAKTEKETNSLLAAIQDLTSKKAGRKADIAVTQKTSQKTKLNPWQAGSEAIAAADITGVNPFDKDELVNFAARAAEKRLRDIDNNITSLKQAIGVTKITVPELEEKIITLQQDAEKEHQKLLAAKGKEKAPFRLSKRDKEEEIENCIKLIAALKSYTKDKAFAQRSNEEDMTKARNQLAQKTARASGFSTKVSATGLADKVALTYQENPDSLEKPAVVFSDLIKASVDKASSDQEIKALRRTVSDINTLMREIAEAVLFHMKKATLGVEGETDTTRGGIKNTRLRTLFAELAGTNSSIENNSDLIKICWIYFPSVDNTLLERAKNNEVFVTLLRTLESKNSNPITRPLESIMDIDSMFALDEAERVFSALKTKSLEEEDLAIFREGLETVLNTAKELYSDVVENSESSESNITDNIWYAILAAFCTPGEIAMLLKRPGDSSTFLTGGSRAELDKQLTAAISILNKKPPTSKGRDSERGIGLGNKILGLSPNKKKGVGSAVPTEADRLTAQYIGLGFNFLFNTNKPGKELQHTNTVGKELYQFFTSEEAKTAPEKLYYILKTHFDSVLGKIKKEKDSYAALPESKPLEFGDLAPATKDSELAKKAGTYEKVYAACKSQFESFLAEAKQLREADFAKLIKFFGIAVAPKEITTLSSGYISTKTEAGKTLLDYAEEFLAKAVESGKISEVADSESDKTFIATADLLSNKITETKEELDLLYKELKDTNEKLDSTTELITKQNRADLRKKAASVLQKVRARLKTVRDLEGDLFDANSAGEPKKRTLTQLKPRLDKIKRLLNKANETGGFDAEILHSYIDGNTDAILEAPIQDILALMSQEVKQAAKAAFDAVFYEDKTEDEFTVEVWKESARTSLVFLNAYLTSQNMNTEETQGRKNAIEKLILSTKDAVEASSDFAWFQQTHELDAEGLANASRKRKEENFDEIELALHQRILIFIRLFNFSDKDRKKVEKADNLFNVPGVPGFPDKLKEVVEKFKNDFVADLEKFDEKFAHISYKDLTSVIKAGDTPIEDMLKTYSLVPGSALSGEPELVAADMLQSLLARKNLKSLEEHARGIWGRIRRLVIKFELSSKLRADKALPIREEDFIKELISLIGALKLSLSTKVEDATLENDIFLRHLLETDVLSERSITNEAGVSRPGNKAELAYDYIISKFKSDKSFSELLNYLELLCDTKRIGWAVKTINAPVIETGVNKAFGLKSAVLLNMLSCVKNYTSIESFDLSLNRDNEDVLSSLLNTNKYPSKFQLWKTPSLIMRLFFLTSIKEAVKTSKLLDQFSGNFMNVTIQEAAKEDETTKKIQSTLETLNSTFAASIFSELYNDFGEGGTLDVTIESDIKRLKQIAEATGNSIYVFTNTGSAKSVVLPESYDSILEFIKTLGGSTFTFDGMEREFKEGSKPSPAMEKMLYLFFRQSTNDLAVALKQVIKIIKTGLNFSCGFEVEKAMAEKENFDVQRGVLDKKQVTSRLDAFMGLPQYVAFLDKFKTIESTDSSLKSTESVGRGPEKRGFLNMRNSFLRAFLTDFTWEAVGKPLASLGVDQFVEETDESAANWKEKIQALVEEFETVIFTGVYKKTNIKAPSDISDKPLQALNNELQAAEDSLTAATTEEEIEEIEDLIDDIQDRIDTVKLSKKESVVPFGSEEADSLVSKAKTKEQQATVKLAKTGVLAYTSGIIVAEDSEGVLGAQLPVKKEALYKNITAQMESGYVPGTKKGERKQKGANSKRVAPGAGAMTLHEVTSVKQILLNFSNGMQEVAKILARVYPKVEGSSIVGDVSVYAKSIEESSSVIENAIEIVAKATIFDLDAQASALDQLKAIKADKKPNIPILQDPTKAVRDAKSKFGARGDFEEVSSFANSAAKDIINNASVTLPIILETLQMWCNKPQELKRKFKERRVNIEDEIAPETVASGTVKKTTGKPEKAVQLGPQALNAVISTLFTAEMNKKTVLDRLVTVRNSEGLLKNPTDLSDLAALVATKVEKETLFTSLKAQLVADNQNVELKTQLTATHKELIEIKAQIQELEDDINFYVVDPQNPNIATRKPKILLFLELLYKQAELVIKNYNATIKNEKTPANKAIRWNKVIKVLQERLDLVINFIERVQSDSNFSTDADEILNKFELLKASTYAIKKPVSESIATRALYAFTRLLQEEIEKLSLTDTLQEEYDDCETQQNYSDAADHLNEELKNLQSIKDPSEQQKKDMLVYKRFISKHEIMVQSFRQKVVLQDKQYILAMAQYLVENGKYIDSYTTQVVDKPGGLPKNVRVIPGAIEAAVISNLNSNPSFAAIRSVINSQIYLGFSTNTDKSAEWVEEKVHLSEFYAIKKFAEGDILFMQAYSKTNQ